MGNSGTGNEINNLDMTTWTTNILKVVKSEFSMDVTVDFLREGKSVLVFTIERISEPSSVQNIIWDKLRSLSQYSQDMQRNKIEAFDENSLIGLDLTAPAKE